MAPQNITASEDTRLVPQSNNDKPGSVLDYLTTPKLGPLFRRIPRVTVESAWYGHIPFAGWVVRASKPRVLVELGTSTGVSYSAFCEAIIEERFNTTCYAVDTWVGDDHSSHYGEEVYEDFRQFHDSRYGAFSRLLRCTFDQALPYMSDQSVDILHIDGCHIYDAVRHDFEFWKPKLSDRAVVLFHDTQVKERDFGVWKFWEEVQRDYLSFEFVHGHGLGVLLVGVAPPPDLAALCELSDPEMTALIRQRFALLGERWMAVQEGFDHHHSLVDQTNRCGRFSEEAAQLQSTLAATQGRLQEEQESRFAAEAATKVKAEQIQELNKTLLDRDRQAIELANALEENCEQLDGLGQLLQTRESELANLQSKLTCNQMEVVQLQSRLAHSESEIKQLRKNIDGALAERDSERSHSKERIDRFETEILKLRLSLQEANNRLNAVSGRIAAKLHRAGELFPNLRSLTVASLKVAYWTCTLTLTARLRRRSQSRMLISSGLFDAAFYLAEYPDVASSGCNPLQHYLNFGISEGRRPNPFFDTAFYLRQNPDVAASGINPLLHYLMHGFREGRQPSDEFDVRLYLDRNPDVAAQGCNPLVHYLQWGRAEGRVSKAGDIPINVSSETDGETEKRQRTGATLDSTLAKAAMAAMHTTRLELFLAGPSRLRLPRSKFPDVTIILVLYNRAELTFACLNSIIECLRGSELGIEVLILDNASADLTSQLLDRVEGATIFRSSENLHFLRGVNQTAKHAIGRNILLLNNDAQLLPGTLEAAARNLASESDIGAVGGRIVLPEGTLQEAGSIIWRDGTCLGYARGRKPDDGEVMFRREVDFCSGAFLLTRRDLFESLGGFDDRFAPMYYEEVDYCVRLWQEGFRVVYDPDVVIVHYEFASSTSSDAFAFQNRNRERFMEKHKNWLQDKYEPSEGNVPWAREVKTAARVLVLEDRIPHTKLGSGFPRSKAMVEEIVDLGARVTFLPMNKLVRDTWPETRATLNPSVEVLLQHSAADLPLLLQQRRGYFDALIVCRPHNMETLSAIENEPSLLSGTKVIYDAEAIFAARELGWRKIRGDDVSAVERARILSKEVDLTAAADVVVSVSRKERALLLEFGSPPVHVLGYPLEIDATSELFEKRTDFLFLGPVLHEGSPNCDALHWFAEEVLPCIRAALGPEVRLKVIGLNLADSIKKLDGTALELLGSVDDLKPHFERARVVVVPTRFAAGIPLKAQQAAALGVPMVVTELIAEQLDWQIGRDLLVASDSKLFAAECVRLYMSHELWESVRGHALERVAEDCSREKFRETLRELLSDVGPKAATFDPPSHHSVSEYLHWIHLYDRLQPADRRAICEHIEKFEAKPTISVVVPVYNTPDRILHRCIQSVTHQIYPHWELCLVDDASSRTEVQDICLEYANADQRVRFIRRETNGHIAKASNTGLELATGEFITFLDHDDELAPHALYMIARELNLRPELDLIFSDEDKIDEFGRRYDPWFKTDWNYELMLSMNCVVHLAAYRTSIVREVNGFRGGYDGSQDYDLALRFLECTCGDRIAHVPSILYHWRAVKGSVARAVGEKPYAYVAALKAIQDHLDRTNTAARVTPEAHQGYYRVRHTLPGEPPRVSLIVAARHERRRLHRTVASLASQTRYANFDLVVVHPVTKNIPSITDLSGSGRAENVSILECDVATNWQSLNNWAAQHVLSPMLCFVSDDVEVITPDWLMEMVSRATRAEVGAVGAKLYDTAGRIDHAGVVVGEHGEARYPHRGLARGETGYFGRAVCAQEFSAVDGGCLLIRREVFLQVGGFAHHEFEETPSDLDLGLRLRKAGYKVVWTPYAELMRQTTPHPIELKNSLVQLLTKQLKKPDTRTYEDPFSNPNLKILGGYFGLASPPRIRKPWLAESGNEH